MVCVKAKISTDASDGLRKNSFRRPFSLLLTAAVICGAITTGTDICVLGSGEAAVTQTIDKFCKKWASES